MELLEKTYALLEDRIEHCKQVKNYIKRLQKIKNQRVIVEGSYDIQLANWRKCKRIINSLRAETCENREEEVTFLKDTFLEDITKLINVCKKEIENLSVTEGEHDKPINKEDIETIRPKIEQSIYKYEETYQELLNFN
jgi:prefoldin subunit 5